MGEEGEATTIRLLVSEENDKTSPPSITFVLIFSALVAVCGSYTQGNAMGYTSPAENGILEDLGLSLSQFSVFGSILTVGALIGAALSGKMADLLGRRGAMLVSDVFCFAGWLAITLSKGAWSLDLGRASLGFGVGSYAYVVPVYIAEIAPDKVRGAFGSLNMVMSACAVSVTFVVGSWINWRTLALLGMIPSVIQLVGVFFIPESPRWLAKVGREKDMEAALLRLRGRNADISTEAAEIIEYTESLNLIQQGGFSELFQRKYARAITVGVGLMIVQQFSGMTGYTYYLSSILESSGFPSNIGSVVASAVQMLGSISCLCLIDKVGRIPLLLVSSSGMFLGALVTGLSFLLQDYHSWTEATPFMTLIGAVVFIGSVCSGVSVISWIIMSEVFPINIKGVGGSFANLVNWVASWIVAYTFNFLFQWSSAGVFFIYAIFAGLGAIFIVKLVPETKGRTLEEIQASITR